MWPRAIEAGGALYVSYARCNSLGAQWRKLGARSASHAGSPTRVPHCARSVMAVEATSNSQAASSVSSVPCNTTSKHSRRGRTEQNSAVDTHAVKREQQHLCVVCQLLYKRPTYVSCACTVLGGTQHVGVRSWSPKRPACPQAGEGTRHRRKALNSHTWYQRQEGQRQGQGQGQGQRQGQGQGQGYEQGQGQGSRETTSTTVSDAALMEHQNCTTSAT